jgi:hypothetical protein
MAPDDTPTTENQPQEPEEPLNEVELRLDPFTVRFCADFIGSRGLLIAQHVQANPLLYPKERKRRAESTMHALATAADGLNEEAARVERLKAAKPHSGIILLQ